MQQIFALAALTMALGLVATDADARGCRGGRGGCGGGGCSGGGCGGAMYGGFGCGGGCGGGGCAFSGECGAGCNGCGQVSMWQWQQPQVAAGAWHQGGNTVIWVPSGYQAPAGFALHAMYQQQAPGYQNVSAPTPIR